MMFNYALIFKISITVSGENENDAIDAVVIGYFDFVNV